MKTRLTLFITFLGFLSGVPASFAQAPTGYPTSTPVKKQIVIELAYNYQMMDYTPPVQIPPLSSRASASLTTPEGAVISYISAMIAQDWQWFISGWTADSANQIEEDLRKQGLTHEAMTRRWDALKNGQHELLARVNTGNYVMITYIAGSATKLFAVLKNDRGVWRLTNELQDDPILAGGAEVIFDASGKAVVRKTVR